MQKLSTNSCEIFFGLGCITSNRSFDFSADADHDLDHRIYKTEVFPPQYRGICKKFAGSAASVKVCGLWLCSILVLL